MEISNSFASFSKEKVIIACDKILQSIIDSRVEDREELVVSYFKHINRKKPWKINLFFFSITIPAKKMRKITMEEAREEVKIVWQDSYDDVKYNYQKQEKKINNIKKMAEMTEGKHVFLTVEDANSLSKYYEQ